ncbi:ribonuclease H2 catalytic subunit RNH201 [Saccharomyces paradoxus]|uniref:Ribonuclease n=1 Tax=Saccharomyces paradoxus TaxID=27291 RepID=A0A8B8UYS5_SACPA|nr:Rnh201 [Saccharomyces paradoxus]QHS75836.1 Rnh201 [Saccharomyces paradoxus]
MVPPTVEASLESPHTKSYFSPVPTALLEQNVSPVIMGIDEAGRGPVLGPMVYAVAYSTQKYQDETIIPNYEFDDSKKLTDPIRRMLFSKMYEDNEELTQIGYATTCITPLDISRGMSKFPPTRNYNLNEQAHDVTMALIDGVIRQNVKLGHVYVDTVGPPASYQKKLEQRFPDVKFTVSKKADSLYCMVSVASVVAKVTRDILVESLKRNPDEVLGSGYPSDPKTVTWLKRNQTSLMGWPANMVRFSWQTCQTLLDDTTKDSILIKWEEQYMDSRKNAAQKTKQLQLQMVAKPVRRKKLRTLDNWYQ